jgi:hypothetical protein
MLLIRYAMKPMNSSTALQAFLAEQSTLFGFHVYATPVRLENFRGCSCISEVYISVWPRVGIYDVERLQDVFLQFPGVMMAKNRAVFREDDEFLYFGSAVIVDAVGTSITVITDEAINQELSTWTRGRDEIIVGPARNIILVRVVSVKLFPDEAIFKKVVGVVGAHQDKIAKATLMATRH